MLVAPPRSSRALRSESACTVTVSLSYRSVRALLWCFFLTANAHSLSEALMHVIGICCMKDLYLPSGLCTGTVLYIMPVYGVSGFMQAPVYHASDCQAAQYTGATYNDASSGACMTSTFLSTALSVELIVLSCGMHAVETCTTQCRAITRQFSQACVALCRGY